MEKNYTNVEMEPKDLFSLMIAQDIIRVQLQPTFVSGTYE